MKFNTTLILLVFSSSLLSQTNVFSFDDVINNTDRPGYVDRSNSQGNQEITWEDTTVRYCAYRISQGGSVMAPWWFESKTYNKGGRIVSVYSSDYSASSVSFSRQDLIYTTWQEWEVTNYSSIDSVTWVVGGKSRFRKFYSTGIDSTSKYDWNSAMNKWIHQSSKITYRTNNARDSSIEWSLGNLSRKTIWHRTNLLAIDSIVEWEFLNGNWNRIAWEKFNGFHSLKESIMSNPVKFWRNTSDNIFAIINYDNSGQIVDSTFNYYTSQQRLDSTVNFGPNQVFNWAEGRRQVGSILKVFSWNNLAALTDYYFQYSNLQGAIIGVESYNSAGQLTSKWGICEVFNTLMSKELSAPKLELYPNPNSGVFTLFGLRQSMDKFELWDLHGHQVRAFLLDNSEQQEINIGDVAAGIYRAVIYGKNGSVTLPVYVSH
jgi:hypothetical protein